MNFFSNITRSEGDPRVLSTGPSSLGNADRLSRALGWFSIGLGLTELVAPRVLTRALGMRGQETLVRAFGVREIGAGLMAMTLEKRTGLWSRVAGDGLDIAAVLTAYRRDNPRRGNVGLALVLLAGVTALDVAAAQAVTARHSRRRDGAVVSYRDRSGFPKGLAQARGGARTANKTANVLSA